MDLKLLSISEMACKPLSEELIPGLVDTGFVLAVATEGSGKTFFGVHCGVHVASGVSWRGRKVHKGPVVYCIAEGVNFFTYRITTAFDCLGVNATDQPFYVLPHSINLRSDESGKITEELQALYIEIAKLPENPRLIVFDTLNRYMPGGDENNQKDCSAFVRGIEMLQNEFGGTVMVMHHVRKAGDLARGSTVLTGAADQVIFCDGNRGKLIEKPVKWSTKEMGKRKDRDPVEQWFKYKLVPMSRGSLVRFNPEIDDPAQYYVMKTDYDEDGDEYETSTVEETLILVPIDGTDEDPSHQSPDEKLAIETLSAHPDGLGIRETMRILGWNQRKVYTVFDGLTTKGIIGYEENSKKHYIFNDAPDGNPFAV
jgi:hypothetical protein